MLMVLEGLNNYGGGTPFDVGGWWEDSGWIEKVGVKGNLCSDKQGVMVSFL